jgi:hypothetical protein
MSFSPQDAARVRSIVENLHLPESNIVNRGLLCDELGIDWRTHQWTYFGIYLTFTGSNLPGLIELGINKTRATVERLFAGASLDVEGIVPRDSLLFTDAFKRYWFYTDAPFPLAEVLELRSEDRMYAEYLVLCCVTKFELGSAKLLANLRADWTLASLREIANWNSAAPERPDPNSDGRGATVTPRTWESAPGFREELQVALNALEQVQ